MSSASGKRQGLGRFRALQLHSASTQCQHRKKKLRCKAGADAMHFGLCKVCTALRPLAARNRRLKMKTWKKTFFLSWRLDIDFLVPKNLFHPSVPDCQGRDFSWETRVSWWSRKKISLSGELCYILWHNVGSHRVSSWVILCLFWVSTWSYYRFDHSQAVSWNLREVLKN